MTGKLATWTPRPRPDGRTLVGRAVRLEKLSAARHGNDLARLLCGDGVAALYDFLGDPPPQAPSDVIAWAQRAEASPDPYFLAIIDQATGKAVGRLALMRVDTVHGGIEVGHVLYAPALQRSIAASEAQFLLMCHVFDDLGYRRYEWKCNALNRPSRNAARRLGFLYEGEFRQHMVVKGRNRDTAWFSMLDGEWPRRRLAFEAWLDPANFAPDGGQKVTLGVHMALASAPPEDGPLMRRLRRATPADSAALAAFQEDAYALNRTITGRTPIPLTWDYARIVGHWECWLVDEAGSIDAALLVEPRSDDLYLHSIAVHPQARDHGLGNTLLRFAERRAAVHAGGTLRFITNQLLTRNVDWYLARGFVIEKFERADERTIVHFFKRIRGNDHER